MGRCADYALEDYPNRVSIFVTGDDKAKIKRLAERNNVTEAKAKEIMMKTDKERSSYYNYYSSKKWGDVRSYDLCVNSSVLGIEGTVDLIIYFANAKLKKNQK